MTRLIPIPTLQPSRNISPGIFDMSRASKGSGSSSLVLVKQVMFTMRDSSTAVMEIAEMLLRSFIPPEINQYFK